MDFSFITFLAELVQIDSHNHDFTSISEVTYDGYQLKYRYSYYKGYCVVSR